MKQNYKHWQDAFPKLKKLGVNKYFQIVGPLLVGIEFVRSSYGDEYVPYLVVCSIWNSDVLNNKIESELSRRLNNPNIYMGLVGTGGRSFNIGYYDSTVIEEAVIQVKKQFLPFEKNIRVEELFKYLNFYSNYSNLSFNTAGLYAILMEFKYLIGVYLGREDLVSQVLKEISEGNNDWDKDSFEHWIGDYNHWFEKLKGITREELTNAVNNFMSNPKITKLNTFKLI